MGTRQQLLSFMPKRRAKGAGRKPSGDRAGVSHAPRPELSSKHPVHVTLKTRPEVGFLRTPPVRHAVRRAVDCSLVWSRAREEFRICHLSIQGEHIHMIAEADDKQALSRGVQGFTISCARRINQVLGRTGKVFADRYHARALTNPRQVRAVLAYVLNNWKHHGFDRHSRQRLDPYATGHAFDGWHDAPPRPKPGDREAFLVWYPKTWLLSTGWKRHGLIPSWEVPG